jgi:hypothetical protein
MKLTYEVAIDTDDSEADRFEIVFGRKILDALYPISRFNGVKNIEVKSMKPENFNIKEKLHEDFWKLTVRSFLNINGKREVFQRETIFFSRDIALKTAEDYSKSDTTLMVELTVHTYFYQGFFSENKTEIPVTTDGGIVFLYKKHGLEEDGDE